MPLQADKVEAMQEAEECRGQVASLQADMQGLRVQLTHAAARPTLTLDPPVLHTQSTYAQLLCHPLQSVLGKQAAGPSCRW